MRAMLIGAAMTLMLASPAPSQTRPGTSPQDAQELVQRYYSNINHGNYAAAYALWSNGGKNSGKSLSQFRAGFAQTARVSVITHAPGPIDAGMMQERIAVPVDVYATLRSGARQHFQGSYTLHLTQPGVGAPAADLTWKIDSASLRPVAN